MLFGDRRSESLSDPLDAVNFIGVMLLCDILFRLEIRRLPAPPRESRYAVAIGVG